VSDEIAGKIAGMIILKIFVDKMIKLLLNLILGFRS